MLSLLSPSHPNLPKDARSLLQTKRNIRIKNIAGGEYFYFGVKHWLSVLMERYPINSEINKLHLHINIDGVPIFNSSTASLWPILCSVRDADWYPFPLALYFGKTKPNSLQDY